MKHKTKSVTPIDDYEFTLSEKMKTFVEKEFRETDEVRRHAIKDLREWAEKNPRITKVRLDSAFLLRFLRAKKFSLPMVKEVLERYLVLRWYEQGEVKILRQPDYRLPAMLELLDLGYIFALPERDSLGRRVIFYRIGAFDPCVHSKYDMVKIHNLTYETLMEDEENQINGFVHVIDSSGMGFNYMTIFTPVEAYRIGKNLEKLVPMRHKEIHGLKVHASIKFAVDFALSQMTEKMRKRVFLHKAVEDVTSAIEKRILPAEYGGITPMREMIELFKKQLESKRDLILKNDEMLVKFELYPQSVLKGSVRSLNKTIDSINNVKPSKDQSLQGSFRKLEID